MEAEYELKLSNNKRITFTGISGEDAAKRYVDLHRDCSVVAWRPKPHGFFFYNPRIRLDSGK